MFAPEIVPCSDGSKLAFMINDTDMVSFPIIAWRVSPQGTYPIICGEIQEPFAVFYPETEEWYIPDAYFFGTGLIAMHKRLSDLAFQAVRDVAQ